MNESTTTEGKRAWTIYVCEDCGGVDVAWEMFQDPGWACSDKKREHGEITAIEVTPRSILTAAIEEFEKRAEHWGTLEAKLDASRHLGDGRYAKTAAVSFREAAHYLRSLLTQEDNPS